MKKKDPNRYPKGWNRRKVEAVIDYDGSSIDPGVAEAWFDMARDVQSRYYEKASRYTTSAFMRLKLGDALASRDMAPHVFESAAEAARER